MRVSTIPILVSTLRGQDIIEQLAKFSHSAVAYIRRSAFSIARGLSSHAGRANDIDVEAQKLFHE